MSDPGRVTDAATNLSPTSPLAPSQNTLRLGSDDVDVRSTTVHVGGPQNDNQQIGPGAQQAPRDVGRSLRNRTVPRWQNRGALGGAVLAGMAGATGLGLGGKIGAFVGGLVGLSFAGAGAIPGAIVGAAIGAAIGAGIARIAAGGGDRQRAERAIISLQDQGRITQHEASQLKGMSNSQLSALVSISKRKSGIQDQPARDEIRQTVLETAAKQGPEAAMRVKAELLNGAALSAHRTPDDPAISNDQTKLDEYRRFLDDAAAAKARSGQRIKPDQARQIAQRALAHVKRFDRNDRDLNAFRIQRQQFENRLGDLLQGISQNRSPQQLLAQLKDVEAAYASMADAEDLGPHGTAEMEARYEAALARAAGRNGMQWQAARAALGKALADDSSLRAIGSAASQILNNDPTGGDTERAEAVRASAARVVKLLSTTAGPLGPSVEADELALADPPVSLPKQQQGTQAVERELLQHRIEGATVQKALDRDTDPWLAGKFVGWVKSKGGSEQQIKTFNDIRMLREERKGEFQVAFASFVQDVSDGKIANIRNEDKIALTNALKKYSNRNPNDVVPMPDPVEHEAKLVLNQINTDIRDTYQNNFEEFKDWLRQSEGLE